jgi:hypothetical protein
MACDGMEILVRLSTNPGLTINEVETQAKAFGKFLAEQLLILEDNIVETLFRTPGKKTDGVVYIGRDNAFGGTSSSSHAPTVINNNASIPSDDMVIFFRSKDEILKLAESASNKGDYTLKHWVEANEELLETVAGTQLRIKIPQDEMGNEAVNRGCFEAICNFIHGVSHPHKDNTCELGRRSMRVAQPGLIQRIEISRELCTIVPGVCDRIGDGEPNPTIVNASGLGPLLSIVFVTSCVGHDIQAVEKALAETQRVLVVYNYAQSSRGTGSNNEHHQSPLTVAQQDHIPTSVEVVKELEQQFGGKEVKVIAADVVGGCGMLALLRGGHHRGPSKIVMEDLDLLSGSFRSCNLGGFEGAVHEQTIKASVPIFKMIKELDHQKQVIANWEQHKHPEVHSKLKDGLATLDAALLASVAVNLAWTGDSREAVRLAREDARAYAYVAEVKGQQGTKPVAFKELVHLDRETVRLAIESVENEAGRIEGLSDLYRETRHDFKNLKRVMNLLGQPHPCGDENVRATVEACGKLRDALVSRLVGLCAVSVRRDCIGLGVSETGRSYLLLLSTMPFQIPAGGPGVRAAETVRAGRGLLFPVEHSEHAHRRRCGRSCASPGLSTIRWLGVEGIVDAAVAQADKGRQGPRGRTAVGGWKPRRRQDRVVGLRQDVLRPRRTAGVRRRPPCRVVSTAYEGDAGEVAAARAARDPAHVQGVR